MKILIVDDHPVLREGICALLQQDGTDIVILQASSASEALELINERADLDVIVLDLMLPGMGGLQALTEFKKLRSELPVIMLSSSEDPRDARNAFAQGAQGYVPKSSSQYILRSAIKLVLNGDLYVPKLLVEPSSKPTATTFAPQGETSFSLTERQIEVLRLINDGRPNKTIAVELGLSEKTVKAHITAIFRALRVVNRTQAATAARKAGLI